MSLGVLLSAYADYIEQAIQDDAGQKEPDRVLRYHGGPAPDDCCTEAGVVSVWWKPLQATTDFPVPLTFKGKLDGALPLVTLHARFATCWTVPEVSPGGVLPEDPACDAEASRLALIAEGVTEALWRLSCSPVGGPLWQEILGETGCGLFRFKQADTGDMSRAGGCASVTWECSAGLSRSPAT